MFEDDGPTTNMGDLILESTPDIYIEKIARKQPAFNLVFQAMSLRFRYEGHRLQQSLQRIDKSGTPSTSLMTGANDSEIKGRKELLEQQRHHFENKIQSLTQELSEATQEIRNLKAIGLENHLKLEALEEKLKVQDE